MESFLPWIGIILTVLINLVTVAYMVGSISARLSFLEQALQKIDQEVRDMRSLHSEIGVVKNKIDNLYQYIQNIQKKIEKEKEE